MSQYPSTSHHLLNNFFSEQRKIYYLNIYAHYSVYENEYYVKIEIA